MGSANPMLLQQSSETLAGRIVYTELSGFNYFEIQRYISYKHHWLCGGFPEPFFIQDDEIRQQWFNAFIMTYIERDLRILGLNAFDFSHPIFRT